MDAIAGSPSPMQGVRGRGAQPAHVFVGIDVTVPVLHYGLDPGSVRCALACVYGPPMDHDWLRARGYGVDTSTALACAPVVAEIVNALRIGAAKVEAARTAARVITDRPAVRLWIEWGVLYCRPFPGEPIARFAARSAKTSQAHADMTRLVEAVEAACADAGFETARVNVQTWRSRCRVLNPKGADGRSLLTADRRVRDALALLVPPDVLAEAITNPDLADALGVAIGGMLGPPARAPRKRRAAATREPRKPKRLVFLGPHLPGRRPGAFKCKRCGGGHYARNCDAGFPEVVPLGSP